MKNLVVLLMCFILKISFARPSINNIVVKTLKDKEILGPGAKFFEDQFNAAIECIRRQLTQGNADMGLPSLAPWQINETISVDVDNKYLLTDLDLNNIMVDGLVAFTTSSLTLSPLIKLDVNYHYDRIHASAAYSGDINLLSLIGLYGTGTINIELTNVNINTSTQYEMMPPLLGDYSFMLSLENAKIEITGIMGDEDMSHSFSIIASEVIKLLIKFFKKEISSLISPIIKNYLNSQIGHLSFLDFLALITNTTCTV